MSEPNRQGHGWTPCHKGRHTAATFGGFNMDDAAMVFMSKEDCQVFILRMGQVDALEPRKVTMEYADE